MIAHLATEDMCVQAALTGALTDMTIMAEIVMQSDIVILTVNPVIKKACVVTGVVVVKIEETTEMIGYPNPMMKELPQNEKELGPIALRVVNIVMAGARHVIGVGVLVQAWCPVNPGPTHRQKRIIHHDHQEPVAQAMIVMVGPKTEAL